MVTLLLPRIAARAERRVQRATAVTARNLNAARHYGYWWVLFSGFFEPVLYLLSIGIGVGALVHSFTLPDGRVIPYAAFVAPAMLAASAMNGALAESTFNFFFKMKFAKVYEQGKDKLGNTRLGDKLMHSEPGTEPVAVGTTSTNTSTSPTSGSTTGTF